MIADVRVTRETDMISYQHEPHGLNDAMINKAVRLIEEREDEIRSAWKRHFGG